MISEIAHLIHFHWPRGVFTGICSLCCIITTKRFCLMTVSTDKCTDKQTVKQWSIYHAFLWDVSARQPSGNDEAQLFELLPANRIINSGVLYPTWKFESSNPLETSRMWLIGTVFRREITELYISLEMWQRSLYQYYSLNGLGLPRPSYLPDLFP